MTFLKQVVPRDPKIFMYCIMVNIKIDGFREETKVLSGLQQLRGSVVTGYAALYTVMGDISRSYSEESMERWRVVGGSMVPRLISGASGGSQGDQERHEEGKGSKRGSHGASVAAGRSQHKYDNQYNQQILFQS